MCYCYTADSAQSARRQAPGYEGSATDFFFMSISFVSSRSPSQRRPRKQASSRAESGRKNPQEQWSGGVTWRGPCGGSFQTGPGPTRPLHPRSPQEAPAIPIPAFLTLSRLEDPIDVIIWFLVFPSHGKRSSEKPSASPSFLSLKHFPLLHVNTATHPVRTDRPRSVGDCSSTPLTYLHYISCLPTAAARAGSICCCRKRQPMDMVKSQMAHPSAVSEATPRLGSRTRVPAARAVMERRWRVKVSHQSQSACRAVGWCV